MGHFKPLSCLGPLLLPPLLLLSFSYRFAQSQYPSPSPSEMVAEVQKHRMSAEGKLFPWPNFKCVPFGWDNNTLQSMDREDQDPNKLVELGLRGLYRLSQIGNTCQAIMEENGERAYNSRTNSHEFCYKSCILNELKFLNNPWSEQVELGDSLDAAVTSFKQLLSPEHSLNSLNISVDLAAEAVVRGFWFKAERYIRRNKKFSCRDYAYYDFLEYAMDDFLKLQCNGSWHNGLKYLDNLPYSNEDVNSDPNLSAPLWPDMSCMKEWMDPKSIKVDTEPEKANLTLKMYELNKVCRAQFTNKQFETEVGGPEGVTSCVKLCILLKFGVVEEILDPSNKSVYNELIHIKRENFREDYFYNEDEPISETLFKLVNSTHKGKDNKPAECFRVERWAPLIHDMEDFFTRQCTESSKPLPVNMSLIWPDFRCVPGWKADEGEQPGNHQGSTSSSSPSTTGAALLRNVNLQCEEEQAKLNLSYGGGSKELLLCKKSCVMKLLRLAGEAGPAETKSILEGFGKVLSDVGGSNTVKKVKFELLRAWKDPILDGLGAEAWARCSSIGWKFMVAKLDTFIESKKTATCGMAVKAENNAAYLANNHMSYTANLDLSCYEDFNYKGIDSGKGDMVPFIKSYNECEELLSRKGIKTECQSMCMFSKMGIFSWGNCTNKDGMEAGSLLEGDQIRSNLLAYFSGPKANDNLLGPAERISKECSPIFETVKTRGCSQMTEVEDCIERILSCNYTGKFLKSSKTDLEGSSSSSDTLSNEDFEYKGYPDMSCRQGYLNTKNSGKGSGLLRKLSVSCNSLVQSGYYKCEELCMLEQMGILLFNESSTDEFGHHNQFFFNDEQEISLKLGGILPDSGGEEATSRIATEVARKCNQSLIDLGPANCNSTEWTRFSSCVSNAMECRAGSLYQPNC